VNESGRKCKERIFFLPSSFSLVKSSSCSLTLFSASAFHNYPKTAKALPPFSMLSYMKPSGISLEILSSYVKEKIKQFRQTFFRRHPGLAINSYF
jgi:hypothetical protein